MANICEPGQEVGCVVYVNFSGVFESVSHNKLLKLNAHCIRDDVYLCLVIMTYVRDRLFECLLPPAADEQRSV